MESIGRTLWGAAAVCGFAMVLAAPASADDASPWSEDSHSAIRLIAGANKSSAAPLRAGVEIKMQPGWKTYWRYPGDSGVPPRFDFSGSDNLKTAKVLYPAPHLFSDEAGNSLGYKDDVTFPLQVTPKHAGQAGDVARQTRLRGVREAVRAGANQCRARACRRRQRAGRGTSTKPKRACRNRCRPPGSALLRGASTMAPSRW